MLLVRKVKALFTSKKDNNNFGNDGNGWILVDEIVPDPSDVTVPELPEQTEIAIGWVPPEEPDYEGYYSSESEEECSDNESRHQHFVGVITVKEGYEIRGGYHSGEGTIMYEGEPQGPMIREDGAQPQGGVTVLSPTSGRFSELHVYTDGSLCDNKSGYGIYAPAYDGMNRAVRLTGPHSIDRAEIQAIIQVLLHIINDESESNNCRDNRSIVIFTDSESTICALHHIRGEREAWKPPKMPFHLRDKLPSIIEKHREELNVLLTLAERLNKEITISHVRSHIGIDGNEWADLFAKMSTMTIQRALRSKANDMARKSDRIWASRSHVRQISIKPCVAKKNRSLLLLDIKDESNNILHPRQQVVWDINHSTTFEELFEEMSEFVGNTYETREDIQFNFHRWDERPSQGKRRGKGKAGAGMRRPM